MITDGFTYLAVIVSFAGAVVWAEKEFYGRLFKYVPAVVIIYFGTMLLATCAVWEKTADVNLYYDLTKRCLLPVMIYLMLLGCDVRKIIRLGPRMLLGFFTASSSIVLGFVVVYGAFKGIYEPDTWKSFAALSGSWMGGTGNMVAVQEALHLSGGKMGYVLLMDSVNYAVWVMVLLAIIPFAPQFNKWTKADTRVLDQIGGYLRAVQETVKQQSAFPDLMVLMGAGLLVSAFAVQLAERLPATAFITPAAWTVILVTAAGIVSGMTPLARVPGSSQLANAALYILVGIIGSRANFAELTQAPVYIISGFLIMGIHAAVLAAAAKIFKLDLFTCAVASLANIGGVASAPILAAAYSKVLIPVGVLMAMLGYVVGTGGGLLVGKILSLL